MKTYFDDTDLNGCYALQKRWENSDGFCWLMALVTWPAAKLARSLKATPTGNFINPELGWSSSPPSLFKALPDFQRTTSAVLLEKNRSGRPQGWLNLPLHVLPNWFNDCNYLLGCMLCRGRLMASKTYADRRKLREGGTETKNSCAEEKSRKAAEGDTSCWLRETEQWHSTLSFFPFLCGTLLVEIFY